MIMQRTISSSAFHLKVPQIQFIGQWLDIPVMLQRRLPHSANCAGDRRDSSGAALGLVLDMPVVVHRSGANFAVVKVVDISVVAERQFPFVLTVQKTTVILQLQFIDKVFFYVSVVQVQHVR